MKKLTSNLLLLVTAIFLILSIMELSARAYCRVKGKIPFFALTTAVKEDALLGWTGTKIMGDPQSQKMKVFFVGDSFTNIDNSFGKMYYDALKRDMDIELFVYAASGYGTLQEYLALDKYLDMIKPDLVVLQVSSNDFINNRWDIERRSYIHNNYKERPYYENGEIKYRYPRGPVLLRQYLIPYSRLAYLLAVRVDKKLSTLAWSEKLKTVENEIETRGLGFPEFKQSTATTLKLMEMIKARCGNTRLLAFSTFDDEPYFSQFKSIFHDLKIDFLTDIPQIAWNAEGAGKVKNNDHWHEKGHAACGAYLAKYIKSLKNQ